MADCKLIPQGERDGKTLYQCKWCKREHASKRRPEEIHRECVARPNVGNSGPGTELKKLLAAWGITSSSCNCDAHAAEMDEKGPDWCEENIDTVVGWLREEADRRSLLFVEGLARLMVLRAIRNAERQSRRLG